MDVTGPTESSLWISAPIAKKTPDASPEPHSHGYCVLDLACLSGATSVKPSGGHSGGPAGCSREQNWARQDEQACFRHKRSCTEYKSKNDQYDRSYTDQNNTNDLEMMILFHHKLSYDGHIVHIYRHIPC
jgi:hypothetical protein